MTPRAHAVIAYSRRGVTLIEMLVVVTIISVFLLLIGPPLLAHVDKSKVVAARQQIALFAQAAATHKLETGHYPANAKELAAALDHEMPKDPWGNEYIYRCPDIISLGADGAPGGEGIAADIVSWKNRAR